MTLLLLLSSADSLFGRDAVTGGLAIGCVVALVFAVWLANGSEPDDE